VQSLLFFCQSLTGLETESSVNDLDSGGGSVSNNDDIFVSTATSPCFSAFRKENPKRERNSEAEATTAKAGGKSKPRVGDEGGKAKESANRISFHVSALFLAVSYFS
jgi:hypothetical protein